MAEEVEIAAMTEEAETAAVTEMEIEMHPCDGTHHLEHSLDLEIELDLSWGTCE
jgi:hypothetical protein